MLVAGVTMWFYTIFRLSSPLPPFLFRSCSLYLCLARNFSMAAVSVALSREIHLGRRDTAAWATGERY